MNVRYLGGATLCALMFTLQLLACSGSTSTPLIATSPATTPAPGTLSAPVSGKSVVRTDDDSALSIALAQGYSCTAYRQSADIYIRVAHKGIDQFQYRIGSSGALVELRDLIGNTDLLAAPVNPANETDRVVQWTLWNMQPKSGVINPDASPGQDGRYNMSQAGRDDGLNAATTSAYLVPGSCTVEVFGLQSDNWSAQNRAHLTGQIAALTRYSINNHGQLDIERILQVGDAYVDGVATRLKSAYLEAWTPLDANRFRAVALDIDADANLSWMYHTGQDIPTYPAIAAAKTKGYVVALSADSDAHVGVALVFGTKPACWLDNEGHCTQPAGTGVLLNLQDFSKTSELPQSAALCLLPALYLGDNVVANTFVDLHLVVAPFHSLTAELAQTLNSLGASLAAPRVLAPGIVVPDDLAQDVADVSQNFANSTNVVRAKSLGQLPVIMQQGIDHSLCVDARQTQATASFVVAGLYACTSGQPAIWTFFADGTLRLAGRCLEPVGGTLTDGGQLEVTACRTGLSQTWQRVGDTLRARNTNLCLDSAAYTKQDPRLLMHPCDATAVQQLNFISPT